MRESKTTDLRRACLITAVIVALASSTEVLATSEPAPPDTSEAAPPSSGPGSPGPGDVEVRGLFDVGGHELFIQCIGTGSPTVIYMHGSIQDTGVTPHRNGIRIATLMQDEVRTCVYDRRNLGNSDTVDAVQTPTDALTDMHNLLAAAGVEPPYVLLGASFGGLLAYLYANTYPGEVVGMVMLDSPFPDEMEVDHLLPDDDTYLAFDAEDEASLERISHYDAHVDAVAFQGEEPAIPMTYITSLQEPWDGWSGVPEYDSQILDLLRGFVDRFSPGKFLEWDVPHFMEVVAADEIAGELREVIALAS